MARMRRDRWNPYAITPYTGQVGTDERATGWTHTHEVRRRAGNRWQKRLVDTNGRWSSPGSPEDITASEGEELYARAQTY